MKGIFFGLHATEAEPARCLRHEKQSFKASEAIQSSVVTSQFQAGVVKIGACVSVERKGLRQCPNVSPIPFLCRRMTAKIVSRDRFNADLDKSRDGIFVHIRMDANYQPRSSGFKTCRATVENIKTCLHIGGRSRNLCDRQQCPLRIVKGRQVSSGRSRFGRQSQ